jgi:hypothetical protein
VALCFETETLDCGCFGGTLAETAAVEYIGVFIHSGMLALLLMVSAKW